MKKTTKMLIIGALAFATTGCFKMPTTEININGDSADYAKVSTDEYKQITNGITYKEVKEIIGGECKQGVKQTIGDISQAIYMCDGENGEVITLTFQNDKLFSKTTTTLEME